MSRDLNVKEELAGKMGEPDRIDTEQESARREQADCVGGSGRGPGIWRVGAES